MNLAHFDLKWVERQKYDEQGSVYVLALEWDNNIASFCTNTSASPTVETVVESCSSGDGYKKSYQAVWTECSTGNATTYFTYLQTNRETPSNTQVWDESGCENSFGSN